MQKEKKTLGEAELEIMQVAWKAGEPLTAHSVLERLEGRNWKLSTLMTSLSRLVDKGFMSCDRSTGTNLYTAVCPEKDYKVQESRSFLEKLYGNSVQNLIATLYSGKVIESADVEELRKFLDELEGKEC